MRTFADTLRKETMKFYNNLPEEQETIINLDYYARRLTIYTSRKKQIENLTKALGEPNILFTIKEKVCGCKWNIPFENTKATSKALSRPLLIGTLNQG